MRQFKSILAAATLAIIFTSCKSESPFAPSRGLEISVDSAVYHLRPFNAVWYEINLTVSVANDSDHDVFIGQDCGHWSLRRANEADQTTLFLGSYDCIEGPRQQPLAIAPGERYTKLFRLMGSHSPDTRPRITIDNNTGTLVFWYQFTDSSGYPVGRVHSAPFRVEPPL